MILAGEHIDIEDKQREHDISGTSRNWSAKSESNARFPRATIYPTLLKSFVFTIVLACFKIVEDGAIGMLHGKSFHESAVLVAGASWKGELILATWFFVMLIPFFGFSELRRVFGPDRLVNVFFHRPQQLGNTPSID